jgi:hypothetical protein
MLTGLERRRVRFALFAALLFIAGKSPGAATAADSVGEMRNTCTVSGGTATSNSEAFSCCWPGWGCVHCAVSDGVIHADQCWVDCDSEECRDANARDRLGLPQPKRPPAATAPGTTPGTLAPPQTKKPNAPAAPGTDAVQP